MSRVLKFRAWDGHEMLTMPVYGNFAVSRFFGYLTGESKVMQFTGLTDSAGKEIYEGDILKYDQSNHLMVVEQLTAGWGLFSKLFSRFGLPDGSTCDSMHFRSYARNSIVVGNLHENPELLNG